MTPVLCLFLGWFVMPSLHKWIIPRWLCNLHNFTSEKVAQYDTPFSHPGCNHCQPNQENHMSSVPTREPKAWTFPPPYPNLPFLGLGFFFFFFCRVASNYHFKKIPRSIIALLKRCLSLACYWTFPPIPHPISSSSLISSVNLRQHCPILPSVTLSSPHAFRSGFSRCIFVVRETSARTVNHLYSSIAINLALWCSLGMSNGMKKNTQTS